MKAILDYHTFTRTLEIPKIVPELKFAALTEISIIPQKNIDVLEPGFKTFIFRYVESGEIFGERFAYYVFDREEEYGR